MSRREVEILPTQWIADESKRPEPSLPVAEATHKLVPIVPTEEMWGGLARAIVMWTRFYRPTQRDLLTHLKNTGETIPDWLAAECRDIDHVPPKGSVAVWIYRAMLDATPIPDTSAGERETGSYEYGSLQDRIDDATRDAAESHKEDCNSYGAGYDSGYLAALIEIRDADPPSPAGERMREAAQAVIDRWDTPNWKDAPATAVVINNLRAALALQGPSGKTGINPHGAVDE